MKISIRITNKFKRYIEQSLKENDIEPTQKNVNRVLRQLKDEFNAEFEYNVDDISMSYAQIFPGEGTKKT